MLTRRGFLGTVLVLGAAPAIVRASSLMPLWVPRRSDFTSGFQSIPNEYPEAFWSAVDSAVNPPVQCSAFFDGRLWWVEKSAPGTVYYSPKFDPITPENVSSIQSALKEWHG